MIDKDCSSSLIFGIVCQLDRYIFGVFLPLTSAGACEKSSWWLWKEKLF